MNEERFEKLAAAYGGDITRWPDAARDAATLFLATRPEVAGRVLAREDRLDAALDALPRYAASADLFERIVASAPVGRPARRPAWRNWLLPAGFSVSLAAATAAGVLLGAQVGARSAVNSDTGSITAELDVSGLAGDV